MPVNQLETFQVSDSTIETREVGDNIFVRESCKALAGVLVTELCVSCPLFNLCSKKPELTLDADLYVEPPVVFDNSEIDNLDMATALDSQAGLDGGREVIIDVAPLPLKKVDHSPALETDEAGALKSYAAQLLDDDINLVVAVSTKPKQVFPKVLTPKPQVSKIGEAKNKNLPNKAKANKIIVGSSQSKKPAVKPTDLPKPTVDYSQNPNVAKTSKQPEPKSIKPEELQVSVKPRVKIDQPRLPRRPEKPTLEPSLKPFVAEVAFYQDSEPEDIEQITDQEPIDFIFELPESEQLFYEQPNYQNYIEILDEIEVWLDTVPAPAIDKILAEFYEAGGYESSEEVAQCIIQKVLDQYNLDLPARPLVPILFALRSEAELTNNALPYHTKLDVAFKKIDRSLVLFAARCLLKSALKD